MTVSETAVRWGPQAALPSQRVPTRFGVDGPLKPPSTWGTTDHHVAVMRSPWYRTVLDLQDIITRATVAFWHASAVRAVHFPITTRTVTCPTGLGSDTLPVPVVVNGRETFLADSMQYLLEYGCRLSDNGCYCVLPSFRGEEPDETHLSQFLHSEAEIPGGLDDVIACIERYVRHLARAILEEYAAPLALAVGDIGHVERMADRNRPFTRLRFEEAVRLLSADGPMVRNSGTWRTLTRQGERKLLETVDEFLWVTHFDHLSVPFYQAFADESQETAANADLFFGIGEVAGAGERHRDAAELRRAMATHQIKEEEYAWYVRMKEEAPMRTAGFGLGVDRFLLWVLQHHDIRDIPPVLPLTGPAKFPARVDTP